MKSPKKRIHERRFVIAVGQISGPKGYKMIFCGIHDVSKDGVRIEVPDDYVFPKELTFKRIATGEVKRTLERTGGFSTTKGAQLADLTGELLETA